MSQSLIGLMRLPQPYTLLTGCQRQYSITPLHMPSSSVNNRTISSFVSLDHYAFHGFIRTLNTSLILVPLLVCSSDTPSHRAPISAWIARHIACILLGMFSLLRMYIHLLLQLLLHHHLLNHSYNLSLTLQPLWSHSARLVLPRL